MREPAGDQHIHRGADELRALYTSFFANGGGIPLEHCAVTDDGRRALEYNVVGWGPDEVAADGRHRRRRPGDSGKLASARVYDDSQPPLS